MGRGGFPQARKTFPALLEHLGDMLGFIRDEAADAGLAETGMAKLELAAEEALVNVINYAYPNGSGEVDLACGRDGTRFSFEISDSGKPYDPTAKPDPDLTLDVEHRNIGGLGVYFFKKAMDEVHYRREDDRNILFLALELNK